MDEDMDFDAGSTSSSQPSYNPPPQTQDGKKML
jgi:hypothetical protein